MKRFALLPLFLATLACAQTPQAQWSQAPRKIAYASALPGVTPVASVAPGTDATGFADSLPAINAALASGITRLVVDVPVGVHGTISWPSGVEITCTPGNGFISTPGANASLLENASQIASPASVTAATQDGSTGGFLVSNQGDHDLVMRGCELNHNSTQSITGANHKVGPNGKFVPAVMLAGINHLEFHDVKVDDPGIYAYAMTNVSHVELDHADCNARVMSTDTTLGANTDCWHVNGPAQDIRGHDSTLGPSGDDSIALNAWDWYSPGATNPSQGQQSQFNGAWQQGPITDVVFHDIFLNGPRWGIRILNSGGGSAVQHVTYDNIWGTVLDRIIEISHYTNSGNCNVDDITFSRFNVARGNSTTSSYWNYVDCNNVGRLSFENTRMPPAQINSPFFHASGSTSIGQLSFNGFTISNASGVQITSPIVQLDGTTTALNVSGVNWQDASNNTGYLLGGANAPAALALSNVNGPAARLVNFTAGTPIYSVQTLGGLTLPVSKATTGTRYVCVDTSGNIISSASACSGT